MENIKTPSRTFWEIWKILKPREKKSEISSLRGGFNIICPVKGQLSKSITQGTGYDKRHAGRTTARPSYVPLELTEKHQSVHLYFCSKHLTA